MKLYKYAWELNDLGPDELYRLLNLGGLKKKIEIMINDTCNGENLF